MAKHKNQGFNGGLITYIPVLFLTFLLLRSFGAHAEMFQTGAFPTEQGIPQIPYFPPKDKPTNSGALIKALLQTPLTTSEVWLDRDINNRIIMCSRDIDEGAQADIYCSIANLVDADDIPQELPKGTIGWKSDKYLLYKTPDNKINVEALHQ